MRNPPVSVHFAKGRVKLLGSGSALPGKLVDNEQILAALKKQCEKSVATKAAIISRRFGIRSRHCARDLAFRVSTPEPTAPQFFVQALNRAISESNSNEVNRCQEISYLIGHTTSSYTLLPPNIAWVAEELDYSGPYMELRQACTGFANALQISIPM